MVGDQSLPSLVLPGGETVASADFLAAFDIDLETAAGPGAGASATGSGAGEYADDAGSLLDGIGRMGSLDTDHWSYESEVSEGFSGLLAEAPLDGDIGLPGGPELSDTPIVPELPEGSDKPDGSEPELHAHPNAQEVTVTTFHEKVRTSTIEIPDKESKDVNIDGITYTTVTGKLDEHNSAEYKKVYGIESPNGDVTEFTNWFSANGADFAEVQAALDTLGSWKNNSSSIGAALSSPTTISTEGVDGSHSLTVSWTMYPSSKNTDDDQTMAVLLKVDNGTYTVVEVSKLHGYTVDGEKQSCEATFAVEEGSTYVVMYVVIENGIDNGTKTILSVEDSAIHTYVPIIEEPVYEDRFSYEAASAGNVITDADPNLDPDDPHAVDHHSDPSYNDTIHVISFTFDGNTYTVPEDGEYTLETTWNDIEITFAMKSDGSFELSASGEGKAPALSELTITYTIDCADPATEPVSSELILTPAYTTNIYSTAGTSILSGSDGHDLFIWTAADLTGGTMDSVVNFALGEDKLLFEGLTDSGSIGIVITDGGKLILTVPGENNSLTVEVNLQAGQLESFTETYTAQHDGNGAGMEQALINALIQNATGG